MLVKLAERTCPSCVPARVGEASAAAADDDDDDEEEEEEDDEDEDDASTLLLAFFVEREFSSHPSPAAGATAAP